MRAEQEEPVSVTQQSGMGRGCQYPSCGCGHGLMVCPRYQDADPRAVEELPVVAVLHRLVGGGHSGGWAGLHRAAREIVTLLRTPAREGADVSAVPLDERVICPACDGWGWQPDDPAWTGRASQAGPVPSASADRREETNG
jgi:hypothetical protein